jgi:hypothetical protein
MSPRRTPPVRIAPRWQHGLNAVMLGVILVACAALVVVIGTQLAYRFDATATREHELSPETRAIIARVQDELTLLLLIDEPRTPLAARQRLDDVLDKFQRTMPTLRVVRINRASPDARAGLSRVLDRLARADAPEIQRHVGVVRAAAGTCAQLADELDRLGAELGALSDAAVADQGGPGSRQGELWRNALSQSASLTRTVAADLRAGGRRAAEVLEQTMDLVAVPRVPAAIDQMRKPLNDLSAWLTRLTAELEGIGRGVGPAGLLSAEVRESAASLARHLPALRDRAARTLLDLTELGRLRTVSVAAEVERADVALLIGPAPRDAREALHRASVLDLNLPELLAGAAPQDPGDTRTADRRFRAEELIAAGIAAFIDRPRPVVVFTHFQPRRLVPGYPDIRAAAERLALRGAEIAEWAVAYDEEEPRAVTAARAEGRPLVFATISSEPAVFEAVLGERGRLEYAAAKGRMATAIRSILERGDGLLLSVNPNRTSTHASGIADPLTEPVEAFGVFVDSARVLMQQVRDPQSPAAPADIRTDMLLVAPGTDHPIGSVILNQPTRLPWLMPIHLKPDRTPPGVQVEAVLRLPASDDLWAESEWSAMRERALRSPGSRAIGASRSNPGNDLGDGSPWTVAAAIRRTVPGEGREQRVVVIASNFWFVDAITRAEVQVDNRVALAFPGNAELLQACVNWLAGQDELIARSSSAQAIPTIPPLSPAQVRALHLVLIVGMPLCLLLLGGVWRLWRG